ncbi:MAG: hypothetical protein HC802_00040 [Caldilineaceae bacterium]|nr:hypothetical protein [Caldilineaceae bacterium]
MTPAKTQFSLPDDFNPETLMVAKVTEFGVFHEVRRAAHLAADLVANGAPADLDLAEQILAQVLDRQEHDPADPHHGNFYWMREDEFVEDLNAVEFVLEALIPMMIRHAARLTPALQERLLAAIKLGLMEVARLDVLVAYTNIAALGVLNTCLGGELLQTPEIATRGFGKLLAWIDYTNRSGHPLEYNSPTYTAVTLRSLKLLTDLTADAPTRQAARALTARLGLSAALHIHSGTGRWAGPHGRAYQPTIVCETAPEVERLRAWLTDGTLPRWLASFVDRPMASFSIQETAERSRGIALTTHQTPTFALGVASQSFHPQANVLMLHYARPNAPRPGVLYSRYLLDDKWFGDAYHATDRTKMLNLPDEGRFLGVQEVNRAIGLYAQIGADHFASAKGVLIWTGRDEIDEIWVGEECITELPHRLDVDQAVVVARR